MSLWEQLEAREVELPAEIWRKVGARWEAEADRARAEYERLGRWRFNRRGALAVRASVYSEAAMWAIFRAIETEADL